MDKKEHDILYYERLRTWAALGILAVLTVLLIGAAVLGVSLFRYKRQIDGIVTRMETLTVEIEELHVDEMVAKANEAVDAIDAAKIGEIVDSLNEVSSQLSEVDWETLTGNINTVAEDASGAIERLDALDIEKLNDAITDLSEVIAPLSRLFGKK